MELEIENWGAIGRKSVCEFPLVGYAAVPITTAAAAAAAAARCGMDLRHLFRMASVKKIGASQIKLFYLFAYYHRSYSYIATASNHTYTGKVVVEVVVVFDYRL